MPDAKSWRLYSQATGGFLAGGVLNKWSSPDKESSFYFLALDHRFAPDHYGGVLIISNTQNQMLRIAEIGVLNRDLRYALDDFSPDSDLHLFWHIENDKNIRAEIIRKLGQNAVFEC